jgi:plasmanylethanolamine desaturase
VKGKGDSLTDGMVTNVMILQAAGAVLLADFASGLVHWAEDAYARKDTPIIGRWIGEANIEHHVKPRAFVSRSWWASSWDLALTSMLVVAGAWWLKVLTCPVWLFAIVTANANQIHKWAHSAPHENGRLVTWLQKLKVLQTQRHHARHHSGKKDSHYCSVTNFLNPLLEELEFWRGLEWFNERVFGLKRRADPTVK